MSFQSYIDAHKTGKCGRVADIGLPWQKCVNDDEVIQYINYCFEVIGLSKRKIDELSLFNGDDLVVITGLMNEINGAHSRVETCYRLLNGKLSKVMNDYVTNVRNKSVVYTGRRA